MSKFAWVTLTTNDTYSLGALVLANSLKRVHTAHQLAVLVTPGVSEAMRNKLKDVFNVVQEVDILDSKDSANLALLARPELGITFTKLHCWRLVQFEKCVFLDADTLVVKNCDELFDREEFSAAPDVSWPDCFNSGVFVFRPSIDTYGKITEFAVKNGSFDGGDQGLLNLFFSDWAHKDISKHLPFTYNTAALASYCYLPAFKQFKDQIKIVHFCGKLKPWFVTFNTQTKNAEIPSDYAHASDIIQMWWSIFCENVHDNLSEQMNDFFGASDVQEVIGNIALYNDPWEEYYERQRKAEEEEKLKKLELQRLREEEDRQRELREVEARRQFEEELERTRLELEELETKRREVEEAIFQQRRHEEERRIWEETQRKEREEADMRIKRQQEEQERHQREIYEKECKERESQSTQTLVQNRVPIDESVPEAGLAGALSSLKLGEHERTPEQEAYEHLMRRQLWESGNIDYCGKDSFDNIMKRITKTLEEKPTKQEDSTKKSDDGSTN